MNEVKKLKLLKRRYKIILFLCGRALKILKLIEKQMKRIDESEDKNNAS